MSHSASDHAWQGSPDRDHLVFRLIALAKLQLDTHFLEPEDAEAYRRRLRRPAGRGKPALPRVLAKWEHEDATLTLTLTALPAAEQFEAALHHPRFSAVLALRYLPEERLLQAARVEQFQGDILEAIAIAGEWAEDEPDLSDESAARAVVMEFAGNKAAPVPGTFRVVPALSAARPEPPAPVDAKAPPPPTAADAREVKALTRAVAAELKRHGSPSLDGASNAWLETRPQTLWPLLDATIAASTARKRDEALVAACRWLLANQLELIRYRLERGHEWARAMLDAYQEKLIALVQARTLPEPDWFELVNALKIAKVPIRPEMAEALTMAAVEASPGEAASAEEIPQQLRRLLDELGRAAESPFMVVEGLAETGTLMPAELRAYMTHELGLSPHPVLREAVPLLLLDPEPLVRQAAAAVLEQVAGPETFSPVMLRRTLLVRNWVPEAEREAVDRLVRKARMKGVSCAQWAPAPALTIQGSMVDGSGAQSLLMTTTGGRTGLFAGLLLKQGFGIRDAWCNPSLSRGEITRSFKEALRTMVWRATDRDHMDMVVQHHLARGLEAGNLPQAAVVEIAEAIGAADWKDRRLDVAAEIERLFAGLPDELRSPAALAASLQRSGSWIAKDRMMQSWFEDDAAIRALVDGPKRPRPKTAVRQVLEQVLPARREAWAEKLLLLVLWMQAGDAKAMAVATWQDCVVLAQELLVGRPMTELPAMEAIAERSIFAARLGSW
ncbi:conserved protein of unknown function [Rhodovastum atsumiense]|uniref:Uncharacterized protein n=1 Tax=Rhodovastum atsumiense TaxID=504468 RepID=A0A5M6IT27_9PROT|nr:hypothetical protein [Rhodovastum atsumiense]KAA5611474.1 hypothetical protein F1189_14170 [Rhodovastum atsumiense]CAH2601164.1 conserved protein of unknown function [Rhodovastum atsumiense]